MWTLKLILWVFFFVPWLKHSSTLIAMGESEALLLGAFTVVFTLAEAFITADFLRGFIHGETRDANWYANPLLSARKNPIHFVLQMVIKSVMVATMVGLTFLVMLYL